MNRRQIVAMSRSQRAKLAKAKRERFVAREAAQGRLVTPWTGEQVRALNEYQQRPDRHPYTCGWHRSDAAHHAWMEQSGDRDLGILRALPDGWHCPACGYRQRWASIRLVEGLSS